SSESDDIRFDFVRFIKFLKDNNIIAVAIAAILSDRINNITNSFVDNLIIPFVNIDINKDGEKDIKKIQDIKIKFFGIEIKIGEFTLSLIKFIIVTYVIFL